MNEFDLINEARPEVAPYDPGVKALARDRLLMAGRPRRSWRRPYTFAVAGGLALAVGLVMVKVPPAPNPPHEMKLLSAAEVLHRAAKAAVDEIEPREDQYIVVKTLQTTDYSLVPYDRSRKHYYLRFKDTVWLRAGERQRGQFVDGVREQTVIEPLAYAGQPIPKSAYEDMGTRVDPIVYCKNAEKDYPTIKRLPTDVEGMRAHLDAMWKPKAKKLTPFLAFLAARELLWQTYLPAAQRSALYQALSTFPGITIDEEVQDAAGRKGIGVGFVSPDGVRWELIFDRDTYALLGDRSVVVDAKAAKAPAGTLVAATAQLEISVADSAPKVKIDDKFKSGRWCTGT
ncbi:CU044_5270 family protein [Nonomuraea sp. SMC257]|uniref:CU044_5270 family protein n=1 Tax=Nonomuraea montanisoli TaxID=2741721 RepID=A0A7Y6M1B6_9ACTN|nr:CU044_5270 family protein [Nonomuraea montanisoli]NUW29959.1 CU044_5270 family protein [Nonomuraea montanisoli]